MDEIDPITMFELCFPGAVTGETEITCPHCKTLLTMSVDDPMGTYSLNCCECDGQFDVDLLEGTIEWIPEQ